MSNVIILEGPDGAGKTHLAARLMLRDYAYRHEGPTPAGVDTMRYYGQLLIDALAEDRNVVFDRFHLGAYVYGPIHRKRVELTPDELTVFDRLVLSRAVRLIVALPPWSVIVQNWRVRRKNEMIQTERCLARVYAAFANLAEKRNYERWNYEDCYEPEARPCDSIKELLLEDDVIGSPRPRYLFVGERPATAFELPFFSMRGSSGYLNHAIWKAGYREDQIAFINALPEDIGPDLDYANDVNEVTHRLSSLKRVIALGRVAQSVCDRQGIECQHVPHPQFWKRFKHHDQRGYVKLLKEARS